MKQLTFCIFILVLADCSYCQIEERDPISVNVEILGKGFFPPVLDIEGSNYSKYYKDCYKARLEIINNEDTTLPVTIWTCFWARNWESSNDSIYILPPPLCTANYPDKINISSKRSLVFYGNIYVKTGSKHKTFKLGFTNMYKNFEDFNSFISADDNVDSIPKKLSAISDGKTKGKTYWSKEVTISNYPSIQYFVR